MIHPPSLNLLHPAFGQMVNTSSVLHIAGQVISVTRNIIFISAIIHSSHISSEFTVLANALDA